MKLAKKLFTLALTLALTLGLGAAALAADAEPTDQQTVAIEKKYVLVGDGVSPAETFTLEPVGSGVVTDGEATSAPALGAITGAAFAEGDATAAGTAKNITVALPAYEHVGVYEYTLREIATAQTAGVLYFGSDIRLVVTVINGADGKLRIAAVHTEAVGEAKSGSFSNLYSAGTLSVQKTVTGNLGDKNKYFTFHVTLTGETGKSYGEAYAVTGGSNAANPSSVAVGETAVFYLRNGETISIANLPYGVSYTVTEDAADGYTTTKTGDTGTINAAAQTAAFENNKTGPLDTGVALESLPYVLILCGVAAAAAVSLLRKRRSAED